MIGGYGIGGRVQAAFLEFFPAAARTRIVASNLAQGVAVGHPERSQRGPFGLIPAARFRLETSPIGHLGDRIAEQSEVTIGMKRLGFGMLDRVLQVLLKLLETKPCRIDRAAQWQSDESRPSDD